MARGAWVAIVCVTAPACFGGAAPVPGDATTAEPTGAGSDAGSGSGAEATSDAADSDSGGTTRGGGMSSTTETALCGNGELDPGEDCDDDNAVRQDGCDNDCTVSTGVRAVSVGASHSCVLYFDGSVQCWGSVEFGRLGHGAAVTEDIGDDEEPSTIGKVPLSLGVVQLESGGAFNCVRDEDGQVQCWGDAAGGKLGTAPLMRKRGVLETIGDNETAEASLPIVLGRSATWLGMGLEHTCAVLTSGALRCWGVNVSGVLGLGDPTVEFLGDDETPASVPVLVFDDNVTRVAGSDDNTCSVFASGDVRCWGSDAFGQLATTQDAQTIGDDESPTTSTNVDLGGAVATDVVVGSGFACALIDDGSVFCWGDSTQGRLGYGDTNNVGVRDTPADKGPVDLGNDAIAVALAAGTHHVCARLQDGEVRCWGRNDSGQLGLGNTDDIGDDEVPSAVPFVQTGGFAVDLDCDTEHCCALLDTGGVRCWGNGGQGRLGYGSVDAVGDDEVPSLMGDVPL